LSAADKPPTYPSSARGVKTDWDKAHAEHKKEEEEEKQDGPAALQKLFQGIYGSGDEVLPIPPCPATNATNATNAADSSMSRHKHVTHVCPAPISLRTPGAP
jgi:hypothetical protein